MAFLEDDLNALEACGSVVEIREVFQRIIEDYGFSSFGFHDASHPWEDDPLSGIDVTVRLDRHLSVENFISTDPCLSAARRTNLPFIGKIVDPGHAAISGTRRTHHFTEQQAHA